MEETQSPDMKPDRFELIEAMEEVYDFPCFYPASVIAKAGEDFLLRLRKALDYEQEGREFRITKKPSSKGNYISYRIELFVDSADMALDMKDFIRKIEGVIVLM